MRNLFLTTALAGFCAVASGAALAQQRAPAPTQAPAPAQDSGDVEAPTPVALTLGGLNLASNPGLDVEAIEIVVTPNKISQTYRVKNGGAAEVKVPASIAMPDLQASAEGTEIYNIDVTKPENPVGLSIVAGGAPVAPRVILRADALGIDRSAEIKAAGLPLTPFGADSDKALKAMKPDQLLKLSDLGLISPPEADQPAAQSVADWTLSVTHAWDQSFAPGKSADIVLSYKPATAQYPLTKENADALDAFKEDACLSAQTIKTLKTKMQGKNAVAMTLTEINVAADKPMRWRPAPATSISVDKPTPDTIVSFCGADAKSLSQPKVVGKVEDSENGDLRIVMISPAH
jgi:hypothetical protein